MEDLILKNVKFYDSIINTAMDTNGCIYIDIFQTSRTIGLGISQANSQVELCQNDILLRKGYHEFELGAFNSRYATHGLELSYVSIWLLKIVLYKKTIEYFPDMPQKLALFQNELEITIHNSYKNVMIKEEHEVVHAKKRGRPCINKEADLINEIRNTNKRIDSLYFDFNKFVSFMTTWKNEVQEMMDLYDIVMDNISYFTNKEQKKWKNHVYEMIDKLMQLDNNYANRTDVLKYIYMYMNKNYGICWDQEYKDFMRQNNTNTKPATIDIICQNEMYRSIFESVLEDKISEYGLNLEENIEEDLNNIDVDKYACLDKIIKPLAEKYNDSSMGNTSTYRKVYSYMATNYKVSWKNHMTRYQNENGTTKFPSKRELIILKPALLEKFEKSVSELLSLNNNVSKETSESEENVEIVIIEQ